MVLFGVSKKYIQRLHRLFRETWYETSAKTNQQNRINYGYNAEGYLTSINDDFSTYSFTYDDIYRLTQEAGTNSTKTSGSVYVTLDYTYDNASNRLSMTETITGAAGSTTNYQYDRLNRLIGMDQNGNTTAANKSIGVDYDDLGLVTELRRYNNLTQSSGAGGQVSRSEFDYDGLNRITDMDHRDSSDAIIAFYDYQYDGVGNLTGQTDTDGSVTFNVNARNEVTVADYGTGDVRTDESYNYDATSDLSSRNGSSFTEGDDNEVTGDGTYTYEYDDEGNLVKQTTVADSSYREFTYDHRNRLTSVTDYSAGAIILSQVTYTYDALNRRILKDDGTTQTAYSYDGSDVQLEFVNGVLAVRYFQGLGIDDVFAEENVGLVGDAQIDWLLTDRQGTIKDVLDGSGDLSQHVIFDTYGNIVQVTDGVGSVQTVNDLLTEYGFTSRRYEQETGLWYFRARYYNSELGRFISRDPAGFVDGTSLYAGYFAGQWGWDPMGEDLNLYPGGHHTNPVSVWIKRGFSNEVAEIFAKTIPAPRHGNSRAHIVYNEKIRMMMDAWMENFDSEADVCPKKAQKFMDSIKNSKDPFIKGFNKAAKKGPEEIKDFWEAKGKKIIDDEIEAINKLPKDQRSKAKLIKYMKYGGKIIKVISIGTTAYLVFKEGPVYAAKVAARDMVFADEVESVAKNLQKAGLADIERRKQRANEKHNWHRRLNEAMDMAGCGC